MARFRLDLGTDPNPKEIAKSVYNGSVDQAVRHINIVKRAPLSIVKKQVKNVLVGDVSPQDLMDPGKFIDSQNRVSTLLGISEKREAPKYYTPYGAAATDYLVLRQIGNNFKTYLGDVEVPNDTQLRGTTQIPVAEEFVDLSAVVTISQKKNILMTRVEGRDRSRKEYISGGDMMVNISGVILGDNPEQYPEDKVKMLRFMLEAKETLSVENPLLSRFGIDGLIILDFKIPQSKASRNKQAYSITAVHERPIEVLQAEEVEKGTKVQEALKAVNEWVALDTAIIRTS